MDKLIDAIFRIAAVLTVIAALYLFAAFVTLDFNPLHWSKFARAITGIFALLTIIIGVAANDSGSIKRSGYDPKDGY